ncbi:cytochrome c oxidase subunit III [Mycobacteroides stephanolepidis]|uniref:Probable cytochrome c oxidase subunit 3 n=1 Tax=[Mycobacterium] stephanolepidis TaxID=1520670 RepID=A0A1Z4F3R7_9MYCO|nr:cytochrome c oxidase subunit 3 [[Mycobacterium] stephanolepidis]BAX99834.1 cytochrome c oxidase subunit III [[Mycobacterium] stephanolepidis]
MTGNPTTGTRTPTDRRDPHVPGEPGLWVFLFGDMIVFAAFFAVIANYRSSEAETFSSGQSLLNLGLGALNTFLLLSGSLLVVLGLEKARNGSAHAARFYLAAAGSGVCFIGVKLIEYHEVTSQGLSPMTSHFFMVYFVFTGIHLVHTIVATTILGAMAYASRGAAASLDIRLLEGGSCFWHLIDLLWIGLFSLLYLA